MNLKIIFSIIMIMSFFPLSAERGYTTMHASARILLLASVPDSLGTVRSIQIKDILSSTRWP